LSKKKRKKLFDKNGFSKKNIHVATGTKYDKSNFDINGLDEHRRDKNGKYHPHESTRHDDFAH